MSTSSVMSVSIRYVVFLSVCLVHQLIFCLGPIVPMVNVPVAKKATTTAGNLIVDIILVGNTLLIQTRRPNEIIPSEYKLHEKYSCAEQEDQHLGILSLLVTQPSCAFRPEMLAALQLLFAIAVARTFRRYMRIVLLSGCGHSI